MNFLGTTLKESAAPLKSRIDAFLKFQQPPNREKTHEILAVFSFSSKHVFKMHLYLRTFYNIVCIKMVEWTVEHQKHFDENKQQRTIKAISHSSQPF